MNNTDINRRRILFITLALWNKTLRSHVISICAAMAAMVAPLSALADTSQTVDPAVVTDVRLGAVYHNIPVLGFQREHGVDVNGEIFFASPFAAPAPAPTTNLEGAWLWLLRPAPSVGVTANTHGDTSQAYVDLNWSVDLDNEQRLWPDRRVFLNFGIGPSFNNGRLQDVTKRHLSLGSHVLFHPAFEVGYRLTEKWSISVFFEHSSNAHLAKTNSGITNLGLRTGLHF